MSVASSVGGNTNDYASLATTISGGQSAGRVGGHRHGGGADKFLQAIQDALNQSGVSSAQPMLANPPAQTANTGLDSDGDNDASRSAAAAGQSSVRRDVHQLVEDLFAAIHQAESQTPATSAASLAAPASQGTVSSTSGVSDGLSSFDAALQNLIQQIGGATGSSNTTTATGAGNDLNSSAGAVSKLQADFVNLVNASAQANNASSTATGTQPSLQTFLQGLLNNLSQTTASAAAGLIG